MTTLRDLIDRYEAAQQIKDPGGVGPLCPRGHERAIHERRYARVGKAPNRCCRECARQRAGERRITEVECMAQPRQPWISQREIVARIEAVRAEDRRTELLAFRRESVERSA